MASAEDLFGLMTDEKRIPSWTRAPAQVNRLLPSFSLLFSPFLITRGVLPIYYSRVRYLIRSIRFLEEE